MSFVPTRLNDFAAKNKAAWTARQRASCDHQSVGMTVRILGVCGSLQARSANLALLKTAGAVAPAGVEVVIFDGLGSLPHFNPDIEASGPSPAVHGWRCALAEANAVLIASPEYGFSLPGALKNGIDWVIGSGELERKIVAITAAVAHRERGQRGLESLRNTLNAVSARIIGGEPIVRGPKFETEVSVLLRALVHEIEQTRLEAHPT
jgi:chromate reductase, NAD(P)H dehydrogenase (quinone)